MAGIFNPIFPSGTDLKVILPKRTRAAEGLRPGVISFPKVEIILNTDTSYQPVACIAVDERVPAPDCLMGIDALDRVTWWLIDMIYTGTEPAPAVPPDMTFEIRPATSNISDLSLQGQTHFISMKDRGMLAQVSGTLCTQWELWMRIHPLEAAGSKLRIQVAGAADRVGTGDFKTRFGLLAHAFP